MAKKSKGSLPKAIGGQATDHGRTGVGTRQKGKGKEWNDSSRCDKAMHDEFRRCIGMTKDGETTVGPVEVPEIEGF